MIKAPEWFHEAVFGGPVVSAEELLEMVAEGEIPVPALVYLVPEGERFDAHFPQEAQKAAPGERRVLHLPPVGNFWFVPAAPVGEQPHPPPRHYMPKAERILTAMQQAIVQQRRRELEGWTGDASKKISLQEEVEALSLALQEVRRLEKAGEATELWVRVVLHRHHWQLNAIRLCLVEFLTSLTKGSGANVAYTSYALIRAIYREHSLVKLGELPARIVAEIMPLLARRQVGSATAHPLLSRVFAYMNAHFAEGIGLSEVAAACFVSPSHLARVFRRETGQTVVAYLQRLRIQHACELLATTSRSLLEVALDSGFESIEHFHRLFRRQCGKTPRAYRLAYRL